MTEVAEVQVRQRMQNYALVSCQEGVRPPVCAVSGNPGHAPASHAGPTFSLIVYVTHSSVLDQGYGNAVLCGVVHL